MDKAFWEDKWQRNEIGFHLDQVHPLLKRFLPALSLAPDSHLLVPLCGKTLDIGFLLAQGFRVTGVELSRKAVEALFDSLGLTANVGDWQGGRVYRHDRLTVLQGDFFAVTQAQLERVDAIYDRAALIALPDSLRADYSRHLMSLTNRAPQLLITLDYQQHDMAGPPFSVSPAMVTSLYGDHYRIRELSRKDIIEHEPRFQERGLHALFESARLLQP
ncbi:MAG: thiopurine S-methyltransferase [Alcanivorax sp.]|nr:thiopurine S-methyltransferase [Alcanivorax sp.]